MNLGVVRRTSNILSLPSSKVHLAPPPLKIQYIIINETKLLMTNRDQDNHLFHFALHYKNLAIFCTFAKKAQSYLYLNQNKENSFKYPLKNLRSKSRKS